MEFAGILPDLETYSALIVVWRYCKHSESGGGESLLKEMLSRGLPPSRGTRRTMLFCASSNPISYQMSVHG